MSFNQKIAAETSTQAQHKLNNDTHQISTPADELRMEQQIINIAICLGEHCRIQIVSIDPKS